MTISNPFRSRHSEAPRSQGAFARTFGPDALDLLPPPPWDHMLVLRSAPGAGKTSLMRAVSADNLRWTYDNKRSVPSLFERLAEMQALGPDGPTVLGIRLNLDRDFTTLLDLPMSAELQQRYLFRLLDARIMREFLRAVAITAGPATSQRPSGEVELHAEPDDGDTADAIRRLGGPAGRDIAGEAERAQQEIFDLIDTLVVDPEKALPSGHHEMYSLRAISYGRVHIDGRELGAHSVLMLDDGHALAATQRELLLGQLRNRTLKMGRWFALRLSALSDDELLGAGDVGRDYEVVDLEAAGRERSGGNVQRTTGSVLSSRKYRRMLVDIADRRAGQSLDRLDEERRTFSAIVDLDPDEVLGDRDMAVLDALRARILARAGAGDRYSNWLREVKDVTGREGLAKLAELEVLLIRDRARRQGDLFEDTLPLAVDEMGQRGSSGLREAALLAVSTEFKLPYYAGLDMLTRLASTNVEQFLDLCGDLFAQMALQASVGRPPRLPPDRQDRLMREASDRFWQEIGTAVPDGHLLKVFIEQVVRIAAAEAAKPTIPYPPGVTGTALSMADRLVLMSPEGRSRIPGADRLHRALSAGVAHNVLWVEMDYSVKKDRWMVIYLNRLLCPRFGLPLGLGGFRERPLRTMAEWMLGRNHEQGSLM